MRIFLRSGALLTLTTTLAACAINPVTGQRELALISEQQEIEMGREASQQVEQEIGLVEDADLQGYVSGIGLELARDSERPDLPWHFAVVDDASPNAFALPGGFIYVTRGLMDLMGSEAQLAAVLGHEIGHVTARHSVSQLSRAQLAQLGLGVGMILVPELQQYGQVAGAGLQLIFLKYGRDDERQADELGFGYALQAGYDVREMARVFQSLDRAAELAGASALPTWLSSHPNPPERIETVERRVDALDRPLDGLRVGRDAYLPRLDGMVYGADPRNGFFDGTAFIHPRLRFRLSFPDGWQGQNTSQMVAAGSPDQDALVQLTLTPESPRTALSAFLADESIQQARAEPGDINGFPAAAAEFTAATESGSFHGVVAFLQDADRTYRLLGYATDAAFDSREPAIRAWIASFQRLTDPDLLAIQPDRVAILTLPRAMTLAAIASAYPSTVPLEELVLINQVDDADVSLASGALVKRVVQ